MKRNTIIALVLAVTMISPPAFATRIFLNGVEITGVRNKTFAKAKVTIDANGDVHMEAPGYEVRVVEEADASNNSANVRPALSRNYFMALQGNSSMAQFDLIIRVNGQERKIIPAGSKAVIEEITDWFRIGKNTVEITARKNLDGGQKSTLASDEVSLVLGEGHVENSIVKIDKVKVQMKVNASQRKDITRTYTVTVH